MSSAACPPSTGVFAFPWGQLWARPSSSPLSTQKAEAATVRSGAWAETGRPRRRAEPKGRCQKNWSLFRSAVPSCPISAPSKCEAPCEVRVRFCSFGSNLRSRQMDVPFGDPRSGGRGHTRLQHHQAQVLLAKSSAARLVPGQTSSFGAMAPAWPRAWQHTLKLRLL